MRPRAQHLLIVPVLLIAASVAAAKEKPAHPIDSLVASVDEAILDAWTQVGLEPVATADDATFVRRATLDIVGRLPTAAEAKAFLDDDAAGKRARLVDRLLEDEGAARHFGEWYARLLLGRDDVRQEHRRALEDWLAEAWRSKTPYDQLVAQVLTAEGPIPENGAGAYVYQFATDRPALAGRTSRLFLGVKIQCAECHDHPWDKWKEDDFHSFAAFFRHVGRAKVPTPIDEANSLNGRVGRLQAQAKQGVPKLKQEVDKATKMLAEATKTLAARQKALKPVDDAFKKLQGPTKASKDRAASAKALADKAKTLSEQAGARLKQKHSKVVHRHLDERNKIAQAAAKLAGEQAKAAVTAAKTWEQRLAAASKKAQPLRKSRDEAKARVDALTEQKKELEAVLVQVPALEKEMNELATLTRELARIMPDLYRDTFAAQKKRVPPDVFRVLDRGGKVNPRPDKAHPTRGDQMPRPLEGEAVAKGTDGTKLRRELAAWLTQHENPWLAKAFVNRLAARLLGQPFVDPVDDLTGPGSRFAETALGQLAVDFRESGYDLRRLVGVLVRTHAYGLDSRAVGTTVAAAPVRELSAPVAFRALVQATLPGLKEVEAGGPRPQREAWIRRWGPLFDDGRDRPASQPQGGIQRALWLMNGAPATDLLRGRKEGLAWRLVHANTTDEKAIQDVYLTVLARAPAEGELTVAKKALPPKPKDAKKQGSWKKARIEAIEDLVWALINGDEFLVNH